MLCVLCVLCGLNFTNWQPMPPLLRYPLQRGNEHAVGWAVPTDDRFYLYPQITQIFADYLFLIVEICVIRG